MGSINLISNANDLASGFGWIGDLQTLPAGHEAHPCLESLNAAKRKGLILL
jgi:hypothetical protein